MEERIKIMKVNTSAQQTPIASTPKKADAAKTEESSKKEKISTQADTKTSISPKAQELATAKQIATQTPDVRTDKVDNLKKRIQEGTYSVDSQLVADKMIAEHLNTVG
jgi:negative regulator of flagellin synthesis FlgM